MLRSPIRFGAFIGMTLGGFAPEIWGGSALSAASILCGMVGGVVGIFVGARFVDF